MTEIEKQMDDGAVIDRMTPGASKTQKILLFILLVI